MSNEQLLAKYVVGLGMSNLSIFHDRLIIKKLISSNNIPIRSISHTEIKKWTKRLVLHMKGGAKLEIKLFRGKSLEEAEDLINSLISAEGVAQAQRLDGTTGRIAFTKNTKWYRNKWAIGSAIVLFIIIIIPGSEDNSKPSSQTKVTESHTQSTEPINEKDQIKKLVINQIKGANNMDKIYVRKIDVVEQINGGWGVFVEYNADDNFSMKMRKAGIEMKMSEIYTALYKNKNNIGSASITAYFPLIDKYGNKNDDVVYKSILDKSEADNVNWDTDSSTLKLIILPGIWTKSILHPEFR